MTEPDEWLAPVPDSCQIRPQTAVPSSQPTDQKGNCGEEPWAETAPLLTLPNPFQADDAGSTPISSSTPSDVDRRGTILPASSWLAMARR